MARILVVMCAEARAGHGLDVAIQAVDFAYAAAALAAVGIDAMVFRICDAIW
jgi:hypothetical protein